jgi:hypothetical protein
LSGTCVVDDLVGEEDAFRLEIFVDWAGVGFFLPFEKKN